MNDQNIRPLVLRENSIKTKAFLPEQKAKLDAENYLAFIMGKPPNTLKHLN